MRMAVARLSKYFIFAATTLLVFVSVVTWFSSIAPEVPFSTGGEDFLGGAVAQSLGHGQPQPYKISDPVIPVRKKKIEQKPIPPPKPEPKVVLEPEPEPEPELKKVPKKPKKPFSPPDLATAVPVPRQKSGFFPVKSPQEHFEVKDDIVYDPKGPKPNQVVMLMAGDGKGHNGDIPHIMESATENRKEYAAYHGYGFHFINITKYYYPEHIHPVWKKLPAIVETFNTYPEAQWVWWLDTDAIIMNSEIELVSHLLSHEAIRMNTMRREEFTADHEKRTGLYTNREVIPENVDLIIAQDFNGLNAGSFFMRRSKFSRMLIDMWSDPILMTATWEGQEQTALQHLIFNHPTIREHVGLVPQRMINAFAVGWKDMGWFEGDLLVHFAGCWMSDNCADQWENYWKYRLTVAELKLLNAEEEEKQQKEKQQPETKVEDASLETTKENEKEEKGSNQRLRRQDFGGSRIVW